MGLVDEIVPSKKLMKRAFKLANRLASVPPPTFQLTKKLLRQPFVDRHKSSEAFDKEALRIWSDTKIREHIRAYLEKTLGKTLK